MGVVFEAWDELQQIPVAIKTLEQENPATVQQLKNEFRALAGVSHQNLVTLHELVHDQGVWLLVMDLVEGVGLSDYVRSQDLEPSDDEESGVQSHPLVDEAHLRSALAQVVHGVHALHEGGWLHGDLKPSNVRVTPEGVVKVLDFGLVRATGADVSHDGRLAGTPVYMAPEQAAGRERGPHSDWYSVGVMLFEALTGKLPFSGSVHQVLEAKQQQDAPRPSDWASGVSAELDDLCHRLLSRDVAKRPNAAMILEGLGPERHCDEEAGARKLRDSRAVAAPFVGRQAELRELGEQMELAAVEGPRVVRVVAASGLGKTALLQQFLRSCRQQGTLVFRGRCFERESVPFKGVDGIVESLSRYLNRLPEVEATALLPRDAFALRTLFPAFDQVPVVVKAPAPRNAIPAATELRRQAFLALKELLARIADRQRVVLFVDDTQWGDADGAALMSEVLRAPNQPTLLVVVASRPMGMDAWAQAMENAPHQHQLELGALPLEASAQLALQLLSENAVPEMVASRAGEIAEESRGHPLFVLELARHVATESNEDVPVRLDHALRLRIEQLSEDERGLLSLVAVSATPLDVEHALHAAELGRSGQTVLKALQTDKLLRKSGAGDRPLVEAQHDRIREVAWAVIPDAERARLHGRLAEVLIEHGVADAEKIAGHLEEGGQATRALRYAIDAAERAGAALAFARAVRLYETALRLVRRTDTDSTEKDGESETPPRATAAQRCYRLEIGLAESLAAAGRGPEAAEAYLRAAMESHQDGRECRRRAAEQLLRSGHTSRGMKLLEVVLAEEGLTLAKTPRQAVTRTLWHRARRSIAGLRFEPVPPEKVSEDARRRADLAWTVSNGLTLVDRLRSAEFHARYLPLVLAVGDPFRAARALALEAAIVAAQGTKARKTSGALIRYADTIGKRYHDADAVAWVTLGRGFRAHLLQRWKDSHQYCGESLAMLRNGYRDVTWETTTAAGFHYLSATYLGRLAYVAEQLPAYVREVEERGDLFARSRAMTSLSVVAWLARGEGAEADRMLNQVDRECEGKAFQIRDLLLVLARTYLDQYEGHHERAYNRFLETWKPAKRAYLHHVEVVRLHSYGLRGLAALATGRKEAIEDAAWCQRAMRREEGVLAEPYRRLLGGGLALHRGDRTAAVEQLGQAVRACRERDMNLHAEAACLVSGMLQGGPHGRGEAERARDWFRGENVVDPDRLAGCLVPGFL